MPAPFAQQQVIGGVCGGLAAYFGIDVAVGRLLMFLLIFFGGISLWVYIILWIVIPPRREIRRAAHDAVCSRGGNNV